LEKFLLFGSAARGEQDEASDLDLIVIKHTTERFVRRLLSVPALPVAADVFVYTPEKFASMQEHGSWSMAAASTVMILTTRYPDALPDPIIPAEAYGREDAEQAVGEAQAVLDQVLQPMAGGPHSEAL
jgi:hypothetical protein